VVVSADTAKELIIAGIRDDLGVRFDGDQLFEGCVNPGELADAIIARLQGVRTDGV
jgi:acyl carrier protein